MCDLHDLVGKLERPRAVDVLNTTLPEILSLFVATGRGEHFGPYMLRNLNGSKTHAACRGVNQHSLAAFEMRQLGERVIGSQESDRQCRGLLMTHAGRLVRECILGRQCV